MPSFGYVAVGPTGKIKKGSMEAEDREQVRAILKQDSMTAIEIKEQSLLTRDLDLPFLNRVKSRDLSVFCRQFVSIVSAGIPISDALSMLVQQTENIRLKKAIQDIHAQIEMGETLSDAMRVHSPKIFPSMMINMIVAGEASGNLERVFDRLAVHFERGTTTKNTVKKALIYPIIVLVIVVVVMAIMMIKVLPEFEDVFDSLNAELPLLTKVVMGTSHWMTQYLWIVVAIIVAIVVGLTIYSRTNSGRHFFGRLIMRLPLIGSMVTKSASASFARMLSILLSSGLPMLDSLEITAKNMTNIHFEEAVLYCREEAAAGSPLAIPLERCALFPPMVYHMANIGEETGDLEEMLNRLADYYDEEVDATTKSLMATLEPLLLLVMAVLVGIVVCAILFPMFDMYDVLGQTF